MRWVRFSLCRIEFLHNSSDDDDPKKSLARKCESVLPYSCVRQERQTFESGQLPDGNRRKSDYHSLKDKREMIGEFGNSTNIHPEILARWFLKP